MGCVYVQGRRKAKCELKRNARGEPVIFVMVASGNLCIFHADTVLTNCQVFTQGLALKIRFLKGRVKMPHVSKQHSYEKYNLGLKRDSFFRS